MYVYICICPCTYVWFLLSGFGCLIYWLVREEVRLASCCVHLLRFRGQASVFWLRVDGALPFLHTQPAKVVVFCRVQLFMVLIIVDPYERATRGCVQEVLTTAQLWLVVTADGRRVPPDGVSNRSAAINIKDNRAIERMSIGFYIWIILKI